MEKETGVPGSDTIEKGTHQNIGRATMVLSALADSSVEGLRLADVVRATGLGKATVHRVLAGLVTHDLAVQDETTGRFFLSMKIVSWAACAGNRFGLANIAEPALRRLCERTQDTVYLTLRDDDEAVCLARREGSFPIKTLTLKAGDRRPLGVGAGSLALLAFLPDEERELLVAAQTGKRMQFGVDEIALQEMISTSCRLGYALNDGKVIPGMSAVAVPIHREDGIPIAAVSVAAITTRMQPPRRENVVASLWQEAREIEAELKPLLTRSSTSQLIRISQGN